MDGGGNVLVVREDGVVLGAGGLVQGGDPVLVRWSADGAELVNALRATSESAPVSAVRLRFEENIP